MHFTWHTNNTDWIHRANSMHSYGIQLSPPQTRAVWWWSVCLHRGRSFSRPQPLSCNLWGCGSGCEQRQWYGCQPTARRETHGQPRPHPPMGLKEKKKILAKHWKHCCRINNKWEVACSDKGPNWHPVCVWHLKHLITHTAPAAAEIPSDFCGESDMGCV